MQVVDGVFAATKAFFDQPEAFKRQLRDRRTNRGRIPLFASAARSLAWGDRHG
jgi:isopenicillin N synthase-like dioxygenase